MLRVPCGATNFFLFSPPMELFPWFRPFTIKTFSKKAIRENISFIQHFRAALPDIHLSMKMRVPPKNHLMAGLDPVDVQDATVVEQIRPTTLLKREAGITPLKLKTDRTAVDSHRAKPLHPQSALADAPGDEAFHQY